MVESVINALLSSQPLHVLTSPDRLFNYLMLFHN
jgi:hypothetical protein